MAGRYRLNVRIAAGGVGEVWRGHDAVLDRAVAIKLLRPEYAQHPETLARFRAEARHAAAVAHPGIAQVYDYGEDGRPFLIMELVSGPSLAAVLAGGPLDADRAMDIVAQTATALEAAHSAGLVHRDIKPANLLIAPGGQVKITDFGIAHAAGSAPLTRTGALVGTPAYLAPERVAGESATPASDLYSLGIVCYECLTGERPFTGTAVEIALAHRHGRVPPLPPYVPSEAAALVASLTARDPAARPRTAVDVARWAGQARDSAATGGGDRPVSLADPAPTLLTDPLPVTMSGPPSQIGASNWAGAGPVPSSGPVRRGYLHRRLLWPVAAVVAVAAALAGWALASSPGASQPPRHPATADSRPAAHRFADVNSALLIGQPVGRVRRQLRHLGLRVQVIWRHHGHLPPGTVVSVTPSGRLRVGTAVVITGALGPPGHRHNDGGDGGNGRGDGGGDGQGNGNGGHGGGN